MKTIKLKLSELVFDFDLYPRTMVDSTHVTSMRQSDRAGVEFPPYTIDKKSKRVSDGFHRGKKDQLEHGADCIVECIEKNYANDGELFLDAMRLNASHGRPLTPFDRARCALRCKRYRVGQAKIAAALGITPATLKAIAEGRVGKIRQTGTAKGNAPPEEIPLKQTIRHKAGQELTPVQVAANGKLSGMNQVFYANQLIILIDADLLDRENEPLMESLQKLHELIGGIVGAAV